METTQTFQNSFKAVKSSDGIVWRMKKFKLFKLDQEDDSPRIFGNDIMRSFSEDLIHFLMGKFSIEIFICIIIAINPFHLGQISRRFILSLSAANESYSCGFHCPIKTRFIYRAMKNYLHIATPTRYANEYLLVDDEWWSDELSAIINRWFTPAFWFSPSYPIFMFDFFISFLLHCSDCVICCESFRALAFPIWMRDARWAWKKRGFPVTWLNICLPFAAFSEMKYFGVCSLMVCGWTRTFHSQC